MTSQCKDVADVTAEWVEHCIAREAMRYRSECNHWVPKSGHNKPPSVCHHAVALNANGLPYDLETTLIQRRSVRTVVAITLLPQKVPEQVARDESGGGCWLVSVCYGFQLPSWWVCLQSRHFSLDKVINPLVYATDEGPGGWCWTSVLQTLYRAPRTIINQQLPLSAGLVLKPAMLAAALVTSHVTPCFQRHNKQELQASVTTRGCCFRYVQRCHFPYFGVLGSSATSLDTIFISILKVYVGGGGYLNKTASSHRNGISVVLPVISSVFFDVDQVDLGLSFGFHVSIWRQFNRLTYYNQKYIYRAGLRVQETTVIS